MKSIGEEYRLQTWLAITQFLLGLAGWLWSGIGSWATEMETDPENGFALFIRQAGILILLLPLFWAIFTIRKERNLKSQWTKKHTIVSGIILAIAMGWTMSYGRVAPHYYIGSRESPHFFGEPTPLSPRGIPDCERSG